MRKIFSFLNVSSCLGVGLYFLIHRLGEASLPKLCEHQGDITNQVIHLGEENNLVLTNFLFNLHNLRSNLCEKKESEKFEIVTHCT